MGVSAPALPLSFLRAGRDPFSQGGPSLGGRCAEYCCDVTAVKSM
nr:hypothetical protein [uncultured Oscillibacter sp.]